MIVRLLLVVTAILLGMGSSSLVADAPKGGHDPEDKGVAHPHDPVLQAEHLDMLYLVKHADVTHMAVHDGRWSDPNTWKDGKLPAAGANVLVPRGKTVTVDHIVPVALR